MYGQPIEFIACAASFSVYTKYLIVFSFLGKLAIVPKYIYAPQSHPQWRVV